MAAVEGTLCPLDDLFVKLVRARLALQVHQPDRALQPLAPLKAHLRAGGNRRSLRRVWLVEAMADAAAARQAAQRGLAFVEQVALEHLDEMYRDGWRRLNPVNAHLEQLAARLSVADLTSSSAACRGCAAAKSSPRRGPARLGNVRETGALSARWAAATRAAAPG